MVPICHYHFDSSIGVAMSNQSGIVASTKKNHGLLHWYSVNLLWTHVFFEKVATLLRNVDLDHQIVQVYELNAFKERSSSIVTL